MILTIIRLAMGPVIAALILWASTVLYSDRLLAGFIYAISAILFVIASLTDWVDGWAARKFDAVSPLGAALDHCADKALVTCVLIVLTFASLTFDLVIATLIILARDVFISGLREGLANSGRALPVDGVGKWKTAAIMAGVTAFLAYQACSLLYAPARVILGLDWASTGLLWIGAILALWSGLRYISAAMKPASA